MRLHPPVIERRIETLVFTTLQAEAYMTAQDDPAVAFKPFNPEYPTCILGVMTPGEAVPVDRSSEPAFDLLINGTVRVTWPLYDIIDRWHRPRAAGATSDDEKIVSRLGSDWRGLLLPPGDLKLAPGDTLAVRVCGHGCEAIRSIYVSTIKYVREAS